MLLAFLVSAGCGGEARTQNGSGGNGPLTASVNSTIKVGTAPSAIAVDSAASKVYLTDAKWVRCVVARNPPVTHTALKNQRHDPSQLVQCGILAPPFFLQRFKPLLDLQRFDSETR